MFQRRFSVEPPGHPHHVGAATARRRRRSVVLRALPPVGRHDARRRRLRRRPRSAAHDEPRAARDRRRRRPVPRGARLGGAALRAGHERDLRLLRRHPRASASTWRSASRRPRTRTCSCCWTSDCTRTCGARWSPRRTRSGRSEGAREARRRQASAARSPLERCSRRCSRSTSAAGYGTSGVTGLHGATSTGPTRSRAATRCRSAVPSSTRRFELGPVVVLPDRRARSRLTGSLAGAVAVRVQLLAGLKYPLAWRLGRDARRRRCSALLLDGRARRSRAGRRCRSGIRHTPRWSRRTVHAGAATGCAAGAHSGSGRALGLRPASQRSARTRIRRPRC